MQTAVADPVSAKWQWRNYSVHYVKAGNRSIHRPPILFIHGYGASTAHWRKNIAKLSHTFEVWAIDLIGFGRSTKAPSGYDSALWRDQLHDFIQTVIGHPAVLIGNSIGGYISLRVAAHRPESVAAVALLNCAGPFTTEQPESETGALRQTITNIIRSVVLSPLPSLLIFQYVRQRSMIRQILSQVYLDQTAVTDELVEDIYRPTCDPGAPQAFAAMFKAPPGKPNDVMLQQMTCPLLALWGEADPWIQARERGAKFRQHYPQLSEFYLQAGHCPHDEVPDQVNALIQDWVLNKVPAERFA
jgi:pimeloyl-ACP methyl ester carboxylesterase